MTDRLVLGSGSQIQSIALAMAELPGTVRVGSPDESLLSMLTDQGINVASLDPTDPSELNQFETVDLIFVIEDSPWDSYELAETAREVFPDAYLITYAGEDANKSDGSLASVTDKVVDPGAVVSEFILDRVGDKGRQLRDIWAVLRDIDRLAIVAHNNPDPDAIASGIALKRLARAAGCEADVCYYGSINHQENRAFVNVLDLDLRNLDPDEGISDYDGVALVDHSRPGVNDDLPEDTPIDIVIDHHPPRAPVDARFVDLRSSVGATSTLLVGYLDQFGVPLTESVATALLFGIHIDTKGLSRQASQEDFDAAATLLSAADLRILERIESPSITAQTMNTVAKAIQNRQIEGRVLLSCVGNLADRDALAQAADRLMTLEGISTTMVYGVKEGTIYISARSRDSEVDIGETLRDAFDQIGSAGGHVDMAGAQITLGLLEAVDEQEESLQEIVEDVVASRFLEAITSHSGPHLTGIYEPDIDVVTERYLGDANEPVPVNLPGLQDERDESSDSDTVNATSATSGGSESNRAGDSQTDEGESTTNGAVDPE